MNDFKRDISEADRIQINKFREQEDMEDEKAERETIETREVFLSSTVVIHQVFRSNPASSR